MTDTIIYISIYIFIVILLGCFLGYVITKIVLTREYQDKLDRFMATKTVDTNVNIEELNRIKNELFQYKKENKLLKEKVQKALLSYEGQKYVLDEHNATLDEFQRRLRGKDEVIEILTSKLSLLEEKEMKLEKKYEEAIDGFLFERKETTKKHKDLLLRANAAENSLKTLKKEESWFSKFFSLPSIMR